MQEMLKFHISPSCEDRTCPFWSKCPKLQTEVVKFNDSTNIDILFIGQGAGEDEERTHKPFVGRAGRVLREELKPKLEQYKLNIALDNTIRARPLDENHKNRPPTELEVGHCLPIIWATIEELQPSIIVPLGASASWDMVPKLRNRRIGSIHGRRFEYRGYMFIPAYHPAACLHAGGEKADELKCAMNGDIDFAIREALQNQQLRLI